ncbi:uncharacterized protein Dwil_GK16213 [Drosophila willistoni]|uniref:WH2 domain-containing protein n=1 Tax=Drosophila willistoni TaxID=7260 RepID=B4N1Y3_DROWI|nr:flocculation protein FLO11 [Drosophila willistoni]XP_023032869.1 flocculation protein FLO11 [Drosophila willistoni]XP_046867612.1 flocculation protein FLO11 [Drosophila willistoni]EDW78372.1 uncharacterized protein Dwil_GK16213 [Drosophila willistoni]
MSSMKGGFSTINRWFGRKKDKSSAAQTASMGKLSKSTTQLHHLSTSTDINSINETSQLEYNRITPIPAATSNAPFEQTFRITVLLPNNQLFVTRLGARVQLSKLLSLVCDHKQLDMEKYEFRSPVDASQVYSCESTIGAVGLSEIRLCLKSESYDSFNADSLPKFHRTGAARDRDSLSSSSDFSSSRNSKITAKTPSPYSSSNSLNSMDSTGMNYTRTPVVVPNKVMAPPPRKKRAAPRPPSQVVIPEQSVPELTREKNPEPAYAVIVKRPQLCMSTPNLSTELDCNGNSPDASDGHYATLELKPEVGVGMSGPEPSPRKRLLQIKKKTTAPAPPPDAGAMSADSISLASTTASITETAPMPQPAPRITTPQTPQTPQTPLTPPPLPVSTAPAIPASNVSKVILNRTPTPEPRSLGSAGEDDDNDAASKQADSGIGEPAPSPEPEPETETKSQLESSSEDEEAIKVYNFKLCQTSVKGDPMPTTLAELAVLTAAAAEEEEEEEEVENGQLDEQENAVTTNGLSEQTSLSSWNYSVPISPPPDFSDQRPKGLSSAASSPSSPHNVIVDELSTIIQQQRLDTLIRKQPEVQEEIESAKPNRLANFTIASISSSSSSSNTATTTTHISTTSTKITRADSFQATGSGNDSVGSLSLRSSSHLSLNKVDAMPNGGLNQRRSSSELSIGESPSLQSLEVIKTILNSRKNSLADSSSINSGSSASTSPQLEQPKNCIPNDEQVEQVDAFISPIKEQSSPPKQDTPPITPVKEQSTKSATAVNLVSPGKPPIKPLKDQVSPTKEQSLPASVPLKTVKEPVSEVIQVKEQIKLDSPVNRHTNFVAPPKEQSSPAPAAPPKPVKVETNHIVTSTEKSPVLTETRSRQGQVSTLKLTTSIETPAPAPAPATAPIAVKTQLAAQPSEKSPPEATTKTEAKPLPPTYRYSGPPSINFATWSERPKSQVAIKNEGDYIFGGSSTSTSTSNSNSNKLTIEVASPILRMGISQRKDYHVPITVKPLTDSSDAKEGQENEVPVQSQSSTLPRPSKSNRFTLPNLNQAPTSITKMSIPSSNTNSLPRPKSVLVESAPVQAAAPTPAPFGQNTLRRTGFKERMLAKEQQEKEQALSVRVSVNGGVTNESSVALRKTTATTTASAPAPVSAPASTTAPAPAPAPAPKPVPAAKSISLLKSTKSVELKVKEPEPEPVILQVKLRPTTQPAAEIKVAANPNPPSPPQPPAPPKQLKLNGGVRPTKVVTPTSPDPRSQLLEAIRNFKRDELNRA